MRYAVLLTLLFFACASPGPEQPDPRGLPWAEVEKLARGTTVHMMMWQGDPLINAYMQDYVMPAVQERYGVRLEIASGQGNIIVQTLMAEEQAGRENSQLDLLWINGETYFQLRQIQALYGPWTARLPNAQYVDFENPFIGKDFQQPVEGYECPWGNVQLALIYDSRYVSDPPDTREELADFVRRHPGKFTFDTHFTGLTFLKSLLIDIAGGAAELEGPFDEEKYRRYSALLWDYIRDIQPFLWKEGRTFPEAVAPMHQLFSNGELWFTMSNNDCEVDNKILQGIFPETARGYFLEKGTIQNSHYLGIPARSANPAGAMVVVNFMLSPEAQLKKYDPTIWGDGTVLAIDRLPAEWQERFRQTPNRQQAPVRTASLPELAPEYMIRLAADFRKEIIE